MAHDVDPAEMMIFLPALCRKNAVPFCFVRGKAALGNLVHMKNATCIAVTEVNAEDLPDLNNLSKQFMEKYNKNDDLKKTWGGGVMGIKNVHKMARRERLRKIELEKKANM